MFASDFSDFLVWPTEHLVPFLQMEPFMGNQNKADTESNKEKKSEKRELHLQRRKYRAMQSSSPA